MALDSLGKMVDDIRSLIPGSGLGIPAHDYISNTYTNGNLTGVVYKTGGAAGTTVATLTLTYDVDGNLETVTRT